MRRKIILALVLLFTIFSVGAIVASWYVSVATRQLGYLVDLHAVEGLRRNLVISIQTVQSDLYTAHTPMARRLDGIVVNVRNMDAAAAECSGCHHPPEIKAKVAEVQDLIVQYKEALSFYITASANKERITRLEKEAVDLGIEILDKTENMSRTASESLEVITAEVISKINGVRTILLITVAFTTTLGVGVSWFLVRSITNPIGRLVNATRIIASGDLGHRINDVKEAEFGELATRFNAMTGALEESYENLRSTNEELRREIKERKEAQRQSEKLQTQLLHAQKMEAVGTLSAGIAHEFGNLLQIVQSCVERLRTIARPGDAGVEEVEMIGESAQRGADLTRRILAFGSKVETRMVPVDMNDLVRRMKSILDRTLPETIEIQIQLTDASVLVEADPAQLEQALLNLAVNARDAMPEGGKLLIETTRSGGDRGDEGWVDLRVSDTGHGMDDEIVQQIFDPFFTTKEIGAGTGLGLSTVYGIVKGCDGTIRCKSEPGRGTSFEIHLPRLRDTTAAIDRDAPTTSAAHRGDATILLVDDEPFLLKMTRANLEAYGYSVHTASNGERAIEFFEQRGEEIDLVILDIGMPGMGGRSCLERLLEIAPDARIIVSTGYSGRENWEEMRQLGARGFLPKPCDLSQILGEIDAVLSS